MIGVDIIDRDYSFSKSKHSFCELAGKVLADSEIHFCHSVSDLDIIWAIKESAYKVWSVKQSASFFNPKRIQILSYYPQEGKAQVSIHGLFIYSHFCASSDFIYSVSSLKEDISSCRLFFDKIPFRSGGIEQMCFMDNSPEKFTHIIHPMGFVYKVKIGSEIYGYSRSHHGRYYLSAIMH